VGASFKASAADAARGKCKESAEQRQALPVQLWFSVSFSRAAAALCAIRRNPLARAFFSSFASQRDDTILLSSKMRDEGARRCSIHNSAMEEIDLTAGPFARLPALRPLSE
jgi:hypothetical protein